MTLFSLSYTPNS